MRLLSLALTFDFLRILFVQFSRYPHQIFDLMHQEPLPAFHAGFSPLAFANSENRASCGRFPSFGFPPRPFPTFFRSISPCSCAERSRFLFAYFFFRERKSKWWAQCGHVHLSISSLKSSVSPLFPSFQAFLLAGGLKWTRTTDLTLIRRAL